MSRLISQIPTTHFCHPPTVSPAVVVSSSSLLYNHDLPFHPGQTPPLSPTVFAASSLYPHRQKHVRPLYPLTPNSPLIVFHRRHHCTRCSYSTNYRSCFVVHEQKFQYVLRPYLDSSSPIRPFSPARPRVVRTCKDAPSCSFRSSDPSAMIRHRRLFHRSEPRPFVVITPESIALDEVIAGLTSLAVGQAGPSLHDSVSSMAVDEDFNSHNAQQNVPPPFSFDSME